MLPKLTKIYSTIAILFFNTFLLFMCLNLAVWGYGRAIDPASIEPAPTATPALEVKILGHLNRDFASLRQVYSDLSEADMIWLILEQANNEMVCDAAVGYRARPFQGHYVNIHEAGFRQPRADNLQPWPPEDHNFNIFVLGGSTTFGYNERGFGTIPAWLQAQLRFETSRDNIMVYNFGNNNYSLNEERLRFAALVQAGYKPDIAIFIDGLNEFSDVDNQAYLSNFQNLCQTNPIGTTAKWQNTLSCQPDEICLPLTQFIDNLRDDDTASSSKSETQAIPFDDGQTNQQVIDKWLVEKGKVEDLARAQNIEVLFVMQPVPGFAYDLAHHLFVDKLEDLTTAQRTVWGYPLWDEEFSNPATTWNEDVLNLTHLGESHTDVIYVDRVHYTLWFMQEIAWEIKHELFARNLIDFSGDSPSGLFFNIREPAPNQTVASDFTIKGWALDLTRGLHEGPGVDTVQIYQGEDCTGDLLGQAAVNLATLYVNLRTGRDQSFANNTFAVELTSVPNGSLTFTACAYFAKEFLGSLTQTVTVE